MKNHSRKIDRFQLLTQEIEREFGEISLYDDDLAGPEYSEVVTDMIEIRRVGCGWCMARHLFNDTDYEHVVFPKKIGSLLWPGDVFLVTMGHVDGEWHILCATPPYETEEISFDDEEEVEDELV